VGGGLDSVAGHAWVVLDSSLYVWDFTEVQNHGVHDMLSLLYLFTQMRSLTQELPARCIRLELPDNGPTFDARLVCIVRHSATTGISNSEGVLGLLVCSLEGYVLSIVSACVAFFLQ